jgi:hypothetical protein
MAAPAALPAVASAETLGRAIDASLRGDKQAQAFLEGLATPDLSGSAVETTLLPVWEAALQLLAASSPGGQSPHAYFAACLLRR